jgi:hypothetical protein
LEKDKTLASGAETTSKQLDNSVLVQQREEESKNKTKGLLLATNESVDENEESKSVNERVSSIDYMPLQEINFQANIGDFDFLVRNTNVNDVAEDPAEWKPREVNSKLFYLEVVAGVDRFFHHASFVVNDLEQEGDYSTFSPQNALNLHLGVNGGIKWRNIYLQTGIHYAQFRQSIAVNHARLKTKEELEVTQKVVLTGVDSSFAGHNIIKVANGNGFSFEYQGAKWDVDSQYITTSDTTRNYSQYRENESEHLKYQLRYVQVPLFIGLEHQFKNHVLIECRLGVNFGFKIGERGEYYNPILEQYQTASAGEFSAVAMKGQFNFGLGYLLSPDLSIRLRPGFNYQIKGPFVNNELNKQLLSPSALGVELGLRYLF